MSKIFIWFTIITMTFLSCVPRKPSSEKIGLVKLDNYFLNNSFTLTADTNYYLIQSADDFNRMFGVAKTMDNQIIQPDFNGQWVIAAVLKETNKSIALTFERAEVSDKKMNAYLNMISNDKTLSYKTVPVALATVPKSGNVKTIHFIVNGRDVKDIAVR